MPALNILVGTARCHIQYNDPPQVQTNTITHNKTNPGSFVKCKLRDPTGNLTFVYMTNKRRHVFLNSAKNSPFLSVLLPSSVCVAAFSADKTQPGGGTDVALTSIWASYPCSASHSRRSTRDTPHSRPRTARGRSYEKKAPLLWILRAMTQHRNRLDAAFIRVACDGERYQSVIRQDFWVHSRCFLFVSTLSRTHTLLKNKHKWRKCIDVT